MLTHCWTLFAIASSFSIVSLTKIFIDTISSSMSITSPERPAQIIYRSKLVTKFPPKPWDATPTSFSHNWWMLVRHSSNILQMTGPDFARPGIPTPEIMLVLCLVGIKVGTIEYNCRGGICYLHRRNLCWSCWLSSVPSSERAANRPPYSILSTFDNTRRRAAGAPITLHILRSKLPSLLRSPRITFHRWPDVFGGWFQGTGNDSVIHVTMLAAIRKVHVASPVSLRITVTFPGMRNHKPSDRSNRVREIATGASSLQWAGPYLP